MYATVALFFPSLHPYPGAPPLPFPEILQQQAQGSWQAARSEPAQQSPPPRAGASHRDSTPDSSSSSPPASASAAGPGVSKHVGLQECVANLKPATFAATNRRISIHLSRLRRPKQLRA
ncbi:hypothetical protein BS78_06G037000 [Paspalum vaginatum]|nr:hypothetical protein BS78_06G037000 [Paspalum vaginatum]